MYTNINEWKKHLMKNESKTEYDSEGNLIYFEDSDGSWVKKEYDSNGNLTYYETSDGSWSQHEYDSNGNEIYRVDSDGKIKDNRNINERKKRNKKRDASNK